MKNVEIDRRRSERNYTNMLIITGVPGVGKSYLIDRASQFGFMSQEVDVRNVGDLLLDTMNTFSPQRPLTRDEVRRQGAREVYLALGLTLGFIAGSAQATERPIAAIAHLIYDQDGNLESAESHYRTLRPTGYIHVIADPEQIQNWIKNDPTRTRKVKSKRQIARHQRKSLRAAERLAQETGARLITIWNKPDNIGENVARIRHEAIQLFI